MRTEAKSSATQRRAVDQALNDVSTNHPTEAAVIRAYVTQLREEAEFWRLRFRSTERKTHA